MKKNLFILCGTLLAASQACAVTLDYRHEYTDDSKVHKDRLTVSHRFDNGIGFSLETKWKSGGTKGDKIYTDIVSNGTESQVSYQHRMDKNWYLQTGLTLESGDNKSIYKPFLTNGYTFDTGIYFNTRYRFEYTRETKPGTDDMKTNRGEFWLGYRYQDWRFEYNYIYKHSDQIRFNNKKWDYEHNLKTVYRLTKAWAPYAELGNVNVRKTTDERQTRYRLGVQYSF